LSWSRNGNLAAGDLPDAMDEPVLLLTGLPLCNAAISASTIGKHPEIQRKDGPLS
jgi:hypothetical protein